MYNPMYYNFYPYQNLNTFIPKKGLFSGLTSTFSKIKWGTILNNTQKTLNVINQAIPVYYQVKPIYNNAKTMFKVLGAVNNKDISNNPSPNSVSINKNGNKKNTSFNEPIFFV